MALELRLHQKMSQQLKMTPRLQQAIEILQLSHTEMAERLRKELEENPLLEEISNENRTDSDAQEHPALDDSTEELHTADQIEQHMAQALHTLDDSPTDATPEPTAVQITEELDLNDFFTSYQDTITNKTTMASSADFIGGREVNFSPAVSLHDHLNLQLQTSQVDSQMREICQLLIAEISDDGYIAQDALTTVFNLLQAQHVTLEHVNDALEHIQHFDPVGVASRTLQECLLLQLESHSQYSPLAVQLVEKHLTDLERHKYQAIIKKLSISMIELGDAIELIAHLEPIPGRRFNTTLPQFITPDIFVRNENGQWIVSQNEDGLPSLKISERYQEAILNASKETKKYIETQVSNASWLLKSLHTRKRTIAKVMEAILVFQQEFFDKGPEFLKPMVLQDIADHIKMHESTVSRVTTNKYVHCPQGLLELKYFFSPAVRGKNTVNDPTREGIATESIRQQIKLLITHEDPTHPLSDQRLVEMLLERKIVIARRTVAKYRKILKIPAAIYRKKIF